MSEENQAPEQTIEQKNQSIKQVLLDTLVHHYSAYSHFIQGLPVHKNLKHICLKHLDDTYLWSKEAIGSIGIVRNDPSQEDEKLAG